MALHSRVFAGENGTIQQHSIISRSQWILMEFWEEENVLHPAPMKALVSNQTIASTLVEHCLGC